jgi:hypothetical protein
MPSYKVDILLRHPEYGVEDALERVLDGACYDAGASGITGITAYQVWPHE